MSTCASARGATNPARRSTLPTPFGWDGLQATSSEEDLTALGLILHPKDDGVPAAATGTPPTPSTPLSPKGGWSPRRKAPPLVMPEISVTVHPPSPVDGPHAPAPRPAPRPAANLRAEIEGATGVLNRNSALIGNTTTPVYWEDEERARQRKADSIKRRERFRKFKIPLILAITVLVGGGISGIIFVIVHYTAQAHH
ncbi:hypothetical protein Q8F55_006421 [Vanrija albida]|uniref:Uncharacterized protein n=1 Tax=Vanrija albida TaxID=181172 RepID=A0ABR3PX52_9TREE